MFGDTHYSATLFRHPLISHPVETTHQPHCLATRSSATLFHHPLVRHFFFFLPSANQPPCLVTHSSATLFGHQLVSHSVIHSSATFFGHLLSSHLVNYCKYIKANSNKGPMLTPWSVLHTWRWCHICLHQSALDGCEFSANCFNFPKHFLVPIWGLVNRGKGCHYMLIMPAGKHAGHNTTVTFCKYTAIEEWMNEHKVDRWQ